MEDSIKSEITQTYDIEIGMLIGANCMKSLEPLKIIPSKDGGLHAYQTKLDVLLGQYKMFDIKIH